MFWFAINVERPLAIFAGIWAEFKATGARPAPRLWLPDNVVGSMPSWRKPILPQDDITSDQRPSRNETQTCFDILAR